LVLEPGDVGLGNRKATAIGRRRAAAPTPLTGNSSTTSKSRSVSQDIIVVLGIAAAGS
jgi:hypothetical protein